MLWKCCTQYANKFGKLSSGHRTGKVSFHSNSKERQCKECSDCHTIALIPHASKVMLKILQGRLQQCVKHEHPDVQAGFRKGRGTRDQIASIHWITEKARKFHKIIYFCFIDYSKPLTVWITTNCGKLLKEMGIGDHLIYLLINLYAGQEATIRTGHGTTDWFQTGKGVCQGCILSPCLFNLICRVSTSWEMLGWIKHKLEWRLPGEISVTSDMQMTPYGRKWRGTKSLLLKVKEESKRVRLKLNIQKTKIMASGSITSWQIDG